MKDASMLREQLLRERARQHKLEDDVNSPEYFEGELRKQQQANLALQSRIAGRPSKRRGDRSSDRYTRSQ